jgi:hypothetical protein
MTMRRNGPGKFSYVIDEYIYEACLNQGTPDEEISHEGLGWFALLELDASARRFIREIAAEAGDELEPEEQELLDGEAALILHERDDGFVGVDWFTDLKEAQDRWAEIEEDLSDEEDEDGEEEPEESEEEDDVFSDEEMAQGYVISDARGGGYNVTHEHQHFEHYRSIENAIEEINDEMEREKFYPNIYYVNDHGNVDLLDQDGNVVKSKV